MRVVIVAAKALGAVLAGPVVVLLVLAEAVRSRVRRRRRAMPRVLWGPTPIISIKFASESLKRRGYTSTTYVDTVYHINVATDFDIHRRDFLPPSKLFEPVRDYVVFAWVLLNADVIVTFFDGGVLRGTVFRSLELPLLKLAGKKLIVSPYGSDVAVPGYLGPFEKAMVDDYPSTVTRADAVKRRVDQFARWADLIVRNLQVGYLPRYDIVWPSLLCIDTDDWAPTGDGQPSPTGDAAVVIVHAPNHRALKGTDALVEAVDRLARDGVPVALDLLERRPNSEVRDAIRRCDIVAEQFIGGYAQFALEGMACGKPVVSRMDWMAQELREHPDLLGCPIVNATPDSLYEVLRDLVGDPDARRRLGELSREYAVSHHSYDAIGRRWQALIDYVWWGTPLQSDFALTPGTISRAT